MVAEALGHVALGFSHAGFIFTIARALEKGRIIWVLTTTGSLFASVSYHVCRSNPDVCLLPYSTLSMMDVYFSFGLVPFALLSLIQFRYFFVEALSVASFYFVSLIVILKSTDETIRPIEGVIVLTALLILLAWILYTRFDTGKFPAYEDETLQSALMLACIGILAFQLQQYPEFMQYYWIIHSLWHLDITVASYFISEAIDSDYPEYKKEWERENLIEKSE